MTHVARILVVCLAWTIVARGGERPAIPADWRAQLEKLHPHVAEEGVAPNDALQRSAADAPNQGLDDKSTALRHTVATEAGTLAATASTSSKSASATGKAPTGASLAAAAAAAATKPPSPVRHRPPPPRPPRPPRPPPPSPRSLSRPRSPPPPPPEEHENVGVGDGGGGGEGDGGDGDVLLGRSDGGRSSGSSSGGDGGGGGGPLLDLTRGLPTHEQYSAFLAAVAAASRGLCRLEVLGRSALGRELWLLTAGDAAQPHFPDAAHPDLPFPKPRVAYVGSMHGDEPSNGVLLLLLVRELCVGPRDGRVQDIVDNTVVYIVPVMNPDGFAAAQRMNANGVDLNRNVLTPDFPYGPPGPLQASLAAPDGSPAYPAAVHWLLYGGPGGMEPETEAVTSWLAAARPSLSANLHGGALVASYALDACDSLGSLTDCRSPEGRLPDLLANAYTAANREMYGTKTDPFGMGAFVNGTTQGARWYPSLGTLQDWAHHAQRLHMLTLELHERKTPLRPGPDVAALYGAHRGPLLRLAEVARLGLRARLLDGATGQPLAGRVTLAAPPGAWPPQVEMGGYVWKLAVPNVLYKGTIRPYDPDAPYLRYNDINFQFRVSTPWDTVVRGTGLGGLSVVRTFRATRR